MIDFSFMVPHVFQNYDSYTKLWKMFMSITFAVLFIGKNIYMLKVLSGNFGNKNEMLMN